MFFGNCGHCPKCGKFCADIRGTGSEARGLYKVAGICKVHGPVDLSHQEWGWDDFFGED